MMLQEIMQVVARQLKNNFLFEENDFEKLVISGRMALSQTVYSLSWSNNKYYASLNEKNFNIFHSNQNAIFLYYLSNNLFKENETYLAERVYYLNKMLNCVELFYEVELPRIFSCDHPLGSVIGRAKYSDYFSFSQGCTVGNNRGIYPRIGHHVAMMSNSKILGDSCVGNYCVIAANTCIKDEDIPDNSVVFGQSPNLIIKNNFVEDSIWRR